MTELEMSEFEMSEVEETRSEFEMAEQWKVELESRILRALIVALPISLVISFVLWAPYVS